MKPTAAPYPLPALLLFLFLPYAPTTGAAEQTASADAGSAAESGSALLTPAETAREIDRLLQLDWERDQVTPAETAAGHEILRRTWLDIAGRIPSAAEARQWLDQEEPPDRARLVDHLLDEPASVRNFTIVWRNSLIPQAGSDARFRGLIPGFEAWLWERLAHRVPYDEWVTEIITAPVTVQRLQGDAVETPTTPDAFYAVRELRPENLATGTSRAFLGIRLDCAQCHDHPFDHWKQDQFWKFAAFYGGFANDTETENPVAAMMNLRVDNARRTLTIPGTDEVVEAAFLTSAPEPARPESDGPQESADARTADNPRRELAEWVTSSDNPWFSRMAANRLWAHFFGRGIIDPPDDFSENNPPSHPEVLDLLAKQFAAHDFDLHFLVRTITQTRAYGLSGRMSHESQEDPIHFARAPLRGLTPEQLFDSLAEAVGFYQPYRSTNPFVIDDNSPRARFLEQFRDDAESPLDRQTTVLQALAMMNSEFVQDATNLQNSRTLRAVAEFPLMSDEQKTETLFLSTLSRYPTEEETARFSQYLEEHSPHTAMTDLFWALLNSSEFILNH